MSAAFAKSFSGKIDRIPERVFRTAAAAVAGGVGAVLGGGKFANGAVTGAFSRLFNDEIHQWRERTNAMRLDRLQDLQEDVYESAFPDNMTNALEILLGRFGPAGEVLGKFIGGTLQEKYVDHYVDTYPNYQPMRRYIDHMTSTITSPSTGQETFLRNYPSEIWLPDGPAITGPRIRREYIGRELR